MPNFNCRVVELKGNAEVGPWFTVEATSAKAAAVAFCDLADVWDIAHWDNGDDATVEVEQFGGDHGTHRMIISAYNVLNFSATPEEN